MSFKILAIIYYTDIKRKNLIHSSAAMVFFLKIKSPFYIVCRQQSYEPQPQLLFDSDLGLWGKDCKDFLHCFHGKQTHNAIKILSCMICMPQSTEHPYEVSWIPNL